MGVRILEGAYDGGDPAAAMVDSTTGYPFGPLWNGHEAREQIEAFCGWLRRGHYMSLAYDIGLDNGDLPPVGREGFDARDWPPTGLAKLVAYWRRTHLNSDGLLDSVKASPAA